MSTNHSVYKCKKIQVCNKITHCGYWLLFRQHKHYWDNIIPLVAPDHANSDTYIKEIRANVITLNIKQYSSLLLSQRNNSATKRQLIQNHTQRTTASRLEARRLSGQVSFTLCYFKTFCTYITVAYTKHRITIYSKILNF